MTTLRSVLALSFVLGCGGDDAPPVDAGPLGMARAETVRALGEEVVVEGYRNFVEEARRLRDLTQAWVSSGADADREAAAASWDRAMGLWQQAELTLVGPAGAMGTTPGGEDRRDAIYSWPIVNRCRVDQELVEQAYADVDAFAAEAVNVRGLDTLEYLLFHTGEDNGCAPNASINLDGTWAPIVAELPARRAAYASTAATLVVRDAEALLARWDEGFLAELQTAGAGSTVYPTAQEALNALSDALFYLDKEAKDMKLADPMGLSMACTATICPELRESRYAARSIPNVADNLRGFRLVFAGANGGMGRGFDDLLASVGAEALAAQAITLIDEAIAIADALEGDVPELLAADANALQPLYDAIKAITDLLKTQILGTLDLELPDRAEGDND
ncbi:MAG: imelysin family protein [Sandaracinus sp.]|nr:imelysin family protein [Sandaracinus sp.]